MRLNGTKTSEFEGDRSLLHKRSGSRRKKNKKKKKTKKPKLPEAFQQSPFKGKVMEGRG